MTTTRHRNPFSELEGFRGQRVRNFTFVIIIDGVSQHSSSFTLFLSFPKKYDIPECFTNDNYNKKNNGSRCLFDDTFPGSSR